MTQAPQGTIGTPQARTGPMPTAGRWGWYRDHEGNEFRRVSTLVKEVETDTKALDDWKLRQVAEGLAIRDDLVLAIKAMGRPNPVDGWTQEQKKKINDIAKEAMAAAKQRDGARSGTAYHDLTERLDRGEDIESVVRGLPALAAETLRAYAFLRRENGWRGVEVERTVVCDELEVAGTLDRIDLVPGLAKLLGPGDCQYGHAARGEAHHGGFFDSGHSDELPVIDDVKTEKNPLLNALHIGPQLAIYSRARRMWRPIGGTVPLLDADGKPRTYPNSGDVIMTPAGEYVPAPCVRQDVAVMVHLAEGRAEPVFVNLIAGWKAAQRAHEQINAKSEAKKPLGRPGAWFAEMPGVKRPKVAAMLVEQAASRDRMNGHALPGAPATVVYDPSRAAAGCDNCAPLLVGASATRVDGTDESQCPCAGCGSTGSPRTVQAAVNAAVATQQAIRDGATGMVTWGPAQPEPAVGTQVEVGGVGFTKIDTMAAVAERGALDDVDRNAVEAVWAATDLDGLARIYEIYTTTLARTWAGPVAEAGAARQDQINCTQRELHSSPGALGCACGWVRGIAP